MDGTPALYGVNQVGHGGPVNSDFSQLHPLACLPESQDPVGSPSNGTELFLVPYRVIFGTDGTGNSGQVFFRELFWDDVDEE